MEIFIHVTELIGTISFAASGAMTGLKKQMDIFGVIILGLTTSVGGGIVRDVLLGINPPQTFKDPIYAIVAVSASAIISIPAVRKGVMRNKKIYDIIMLILDTIGLAIFTVVGVCITYEAMKKPGTFLIISIGVITGCGGGVIRDIFAGDTPYIFKKHVYACASLAGALLCKALRHILGDVYSMLAGIAVIAIIRFLSAYFKWNLPKPKEISI